MVNYVKIYTIKYQKRNFSDIHLFIFINKTNKFFETFQINKIICIKLLIVKIDLIGKFTKIITLIIFYSYYKKINSYLFYI